MDVLGGVRFPGIQGECSSSVETDEDREREIGETIAGIERHFQSLGIDISLIGGNDGSISSLNDGEFDALLDSEIAEIKQNVLSIGGEDFYIN